MDGLRALSIALVIISHLGGAHGTPWGSSSIASGWGILGVRVFFVISGFLITTLLLAEHERSGRIELLAFFRRRAWRLLPAAYVFLATLALAESLGWISLGPNDLLSGATYWANYDQHRSWNTGHLWSLAVEEQFYVLWPALLMLLAPRRSMKVAAGVLLLVPAIRLVIWLGWQEAWPIGQTFETTADALAAGCLLAGSRDWLWSQGWYRRICSGPVIAACAVFLLLGTSLISDRPRIDALLGTSALIAATVLILDWCLRNPQGRVGKLLNTAPVMWVGTLSYSLYLWQQPFLNRSSTEPWAAWPANLLLACACGIGSYYLVERPALRMRQRTERGAPPASLDTQPTIRDGAS